MFRNHISHFCLAVGLMAILSATSGRSQQQNITPEESFATENAILDTSVLFAIGAREARQELRGAFGWPTFQEGLVEGVYFRFDPDGYARFAPTPRLDTDVFEVICRPRTYVCMARKGALAVMLNSRGQVEMQLENVMDTDRFALSEGIHELPLPGTVLQPLDQRMEILLASGGDFVVRRGENEVERISLTGFGAIVTYLRWVSARQDYTVLPRGWPVPNSVATQQATGLTQSAGWKSPMPQPHVINRTIPATAVIEPVTILQNAAGEGVEEVKDEIKTLRDLLEARNQSTETAQTIDRQTEIERLQFMVQSLTDEVAQLQQGGRPATVLPAAVPLAVEPESELAEKPDARKLAMRLEYLMTEIGLAPDVALMLIQQSDETTSAVSAQGDVVDDILRDLRAQLPVEAGADGPTASVPAPEYQLLTDYFRSEFSAE
jgi:hypothetical protein